jgi:hypothetical protein
MKNNEWIGLPVYQVNLYPKKIKDIAKKVGVSEEEIANNEGVSPGIILWEWIKREDIMEIFRIIEYPENTNMTILLLLSGEELIINMPHNKLMKKIHKFLLTESQYDFDQPDITKIPVTQVDGDLNE